MICGCGGVVELNDENCELVVRVRACVRCVCAVRSALCVRVHECVSFFFAFSFVSFTNASSVHCNYGGREWVQTVRDTFKMNHTQQGYALRPSGGVSPPRCCTTAAATCMVTRTVCDRFKHRPQRYSTKDEKKKKRKE